MTAQKAREKFDEYMQGILGHFFVKVDPGPMGDEELIKRTAVLKEEQIAQKTDPDDYFRSGHMQMLGWMQLLEQHGFNLRTAAAILEFGCGTARLVRHLRCIDGIWLVGSDVNEDMVSWCKKNVPGADFYLNRLSPPLDFAEEGSFDLVFANSVFTHIPLEFQQTWIEELHRILRPGGFLLCNVIGPVLEKKMLNDSEREKIRKDGHLTLDANDPKASLSTQLIGSWDIFQARREVLKAFGAVFRVCDYIPVPNSLDLLILRK